MGWEFQGFDAMIGTVISWVTTHLLWGLCCYFEDDWSEWQVSMGKGGPYEAIYEAKAEKVLMNLVEGHSHCYYAVSESLP